MVERSGNATLEQRPDGFDPIDVDIASDVSFGVVDGLMFELGTVEPVVRRDNQGQPLITSRSCSRFVNVERVQSWSADL